MIDGALSDTADHIQTLTKARAQPHVLDDATIDRVERVHREQLEFVDIYAEQLRLWRDQDPSAVQRRELERLEEQIVACGRLPPTSSHSQPSSVRAPSTASWP